MVVGVGTASCPCAPGIVHFAMATDAPRQSRDRYVTTDAKRRTWPRHTLWRARPMALQKHLQRSGAAKGSMQAASPVPARTPPCPNSHFMVAFLTKTCVLCGPGATIETPDSHQTVLGAPVATVPPATKIMDATTGQAP